VTIQMEQVRVLRLESPQNRGAYLIEPFVLIFDEAHAHELQ
jgi:hypothetical protein